MSENGPVGNFGTRWMYIIYIYNADAMINRTSSEQPDIFTTMSLCNWGYQQNKEVEQQMFMGVLEKLAADYKPDAIFLESSGLADPISIAQILQSPKISDKVSLQNIYTLVDAVNFKQTFRIMTRFKHQVMVADKLIINKIDLVDDVEELQNQLKEWNPFAEQKLTTHCDIKFDYFFDQPETNTYKSVPLVGGGNKPNMGLSLLRIHEEITEERLNTFIHQSCSRC